MVSFRFVLAKTSNLGILRNTSHREKKGCIFYSLNFFGQNDEEAVYYLNPT